jgi:hypothetical protein
MKQGPGTVCGPMVRELCTAGGIEGAADLGGQLGELRSCCGSESLGEGHSSGKRACRKCQDANAALAGAEKGCRWQAAVERAEAARVAEDTKEAAHAGGGKSLTPNPPSCNWR